jgi:hypothetical protein
MAWNWQDALSGGATGAATGASFGGGWGAAGGAGVGALLGLLKDSGDKPMSPELEKLFNAQVAKMQATNPMYESVMRLAFDRLPTAAREGLHVPSVMEALAQLDTEDAPAGYDSNPHDTPPTPGRSAQPRDGGLPPGSTLSSGDFAQPDAVRYLLKQQLLRQRMADPIIQAITKMAQSRMPRGYQGSNFVLPTLPAIAPRSDGLPGLPPGYGDPDNPSPGPPKPTPPTVPTMDPFLALLQSRRA